VPLQCYSWQCHSNRYIFNNNNNYSLYAWYSLFVLIVPLNANQARPHCCCYSNILLTTHIHWTVMPCILSMPNVQFSYIVQYVQLLIATTSITRHSITCPMLHCRVLPFSGMISEPWPMTVLWQCCSRFPVISLLTNLQTNTGCLMASSDDYNNNSDKNQKFMISK